GLRRIRHHSRLGAHRPLRGGRRPGGLGLGGGDLRSLGALLRPLAPPATHIGERLRSGADRLVSTVSRRRPASLRPIASITLPVGRPSCRDKRSSTSPGSTPHSSASPKAQAFN